MKDSAISGPLISTAELLYLAFLVSWTQQSSCLLHSMNHPGKAVEMWLIHYESIYNILSVPVLNNSLTKVNKIFYFCHSSQSWNIQHSHTVSIKCSFSCHFYEPKIRRGQYATLRLEHLHQFLRLIFLLHIFQFKSFQLLVFFQVSFPTTCIRYAILIFSMREHIHT